MVKSKWRHRELGRSFTDLLCSLSMAEISLVPAVLFRPDGPGMELFETDESDVKHVHNFVVPLPKLDSLGVRVMVR